LAKVQFEQAQAIREAEHAKTRAEYKLQSHIDSLPDTIEKAKKYMQESIIESFAEEVEALQQRVEDTKTERDKEMRPQVTHPT
jgi:polyhydroxyalkanoate synthesis regulator phasin